MTVLCRPQHRVKWEGEHVNESTQSSRPDETLRSPTIYPVHHMPILVVQERSPHRGQVVDGNAIEGAENAYIPECVEVPLVVCCPATYFVGLNSLQTCATLIYDTQRPHQAISQEFHVRGPRQESQHATEDDFIEGVETRPSTYIPAWLKLSLMVCCPIVCFWVLNLTGVANSSIQSVTFRMFTMKLVSLLLECSAHQVSESKLKGVGRRTKHVFFSAILGLVAAVLTTISQIDSRADGECAWDDTFQPARNEERQSAVPECSLLNTATGGAIRIVARQLWCCSMVRDGDFLSRPAILSSAATACAAALWTGLAAALTTSAAVTFAGAGCLAASSALLLAWGARGDPYGEWLLCPIVWLASLATPVAMFTSPLPFLYDGVAVTGGMISCTSHVRRAVAAIAALVETVLLPAVPGGAIAAMGAAMVARLVLSPAAAAAAARLPAARARAAARSPALRSAAAAAAARGGLVAADGRIAAAHVFEFDPAGPQERWQWVRRGGTRRGRFAVRPFDEYRQLGSAAADNSEEGGRTGSAPAAGTRRTAGVGPGAAPGGLHALCCCCGYGA